MANMKTHLIIAACLGLASIGGAETAAHSDRRKNNLTEQPAVRHRRLLVKQRFELAPLFESTINADFRHIVGGGLKLEYHFSDMFSIGVVGVGSTALDTGLVKKIDGTLTDSPMNPREPTRAQFDDRLNTMPLHG